MRRTDLVSSSETEARLLLLIDGFSRKRGGLRLLEGRTKLAKLDFFLRYPRYLAQALDEVDPGRLHQPVDDSRIAERMMRYRYGPWDPQYFSALGSLIGRDLIVALPTGRGFGYRTTERGEALALRLVEDDAFHEIAERVAVLRAKFDWTGSKLKAFVYQLVPSLTSMSWTEEVT